jgi:acetyltransferase
MTSQNPIMTDLVGDFLQHENSALDAFFSPETVAVIGATEKMGSVGRTVLWNLISNPFGGVVFPVNPKRPSVMGIKAYPSISEVPEKVDLAVVVTPAPSIPDIISECADAGVRCAIVISAGFKELGAPGIELERQILVHARRGKMRIIGPNCLGLMNPLSGLNATFAGAVARPGNVGFISQSGALCTAVLDWSIQERVGFSAFVSIGSMVDVDWGDLIDYLGRDVRTQSIVIYMESIGNARSFLSAAREVSQTKPIIVIKAGRTEAAAKAAASHTGSLTGSDDVLDAAFKRVGVLRVNNIEDLFDMAEVLGKQPRPKGRRLTILTNAGGPGVLATDSLILEGGKLADISPESFKAYSDLLPPHWSRNNPVDILGDAGPDRYAKALEIAAKDPNSDGLLVILTPQDMTDPLETAVQLRPYAKIEGKPVLASWMGGPAVAPGVDVLNRADIPTYPYPDTAAKAFNYMCQYAENLAALYETPRLDIPGLENVDRVRAREIIEGARREQRTILTEAESKNLLASYGIPTVETRIAVNLEEALQAAESIGYPVVLKLYSTTITHKTDVGGVQLDLADAEAVRNAYSFIEKSVTARVGSEHFEGVTVQPMLSLQDGYEIIVGSSLDTQFGPVMLFGLGGQLVEVFKDSALALPPLTGPLARSMMKRTKIYKALGGVRGRKSVDLDKLENVLVRFSQLVVELPQIIESDINPLFVSPDRLLALDARFVLHDPSVNEETFPQVAIRPYPIQYSGTAVTSSGLKLQLEPIRPEDEPLMVEFHKSLSEQTVYQRYAQHYNLEQRITHDRLSRVCYVDYDRKIVITAGVSDPSDSSRKIIAVGRLGKIRGTNDAKVAILVADSYQDQGVGSALLTKLIEIAKEEKIDRIIASVLPENKKMLSFCERFGFLAASKETTTKENFVVVELKL